MKHEKIPVPALFFQEVDPSEDPCLGCVFYDMLHCEEPIELDCTNYEGKSGRWLLTNVREG